MACMMQQIQNGLRLLKPNILEYEIVRAQQKLMKIISEQDLSKINNVILGAKTYEIISEVLETKDPYKNLKKKYNDKALELYSNLKNSIDKFYTQNIQNLNSSELEEILNLVLKASIIGNSIDFGTNLNINIEQEIEKLINTKLISNVEIKEFINDINKSNKILIVGDNAGEIVFDKLFIEKLKKIFPHKEIIYSVRAGPIINDATLEDAEYINLTKTCRVVESSVSPGIILEWSSKDFIEIFNSSNFIISKGQGNFESIIDIDTTNKNVYFLLKIKCILIQKIFKMPIGSIVLMKKNKELIDRVEK